MAERLINYTPPIPEDLAQLHDDSLAGELRWQNGMQSASQPETLKDHVVDSIYIHEQNEKIYPALFKEVDSPDTSDMIYIHDTGEIGGLDLSHSVPDYDKLRAEIKRRERINFWKINRKYNEDPGLRKRAWNLYERYNRCSPNDRIANYVHLVDKIQAVKYGAKFVYARRQLRTKAARQQQANHCYKLLMKFVPNLHFNLEEDAQSDLLDFADSALLALIENGYSEKEVDSYRKKLRDVTNYSQEEVV